MKDLVTRPKEGFCYEYPEIKCRLGSHYPHCDMLCPMNSVGREQIIATMNREVSDEKQQRDNG